MLQELGRDAYVRALTEHRRLLREAFTSHGGVEVEMQGDSFFFAFPFARDAVAAAAAAQRALAAARLGVTTDQGPDRPPHRRADAGRRPLCRPRRPLGGARHERGPRRPGAASQRTAELVEGELADGVSLLDLGEHRLKDLTAPQQLFQVGEDEFPPLKTLARRTNLPVAASPLIGREEELGISST